MNRTLASALVLAAAAASSSFAGSFSDDFSSYTAGATLGSPWTQSVPDNNGTLLYRVTADSGNVFGQGAANQYLSISDTLSGNPNLQFYYASSSISGSSGQLSFSFYDPQLTTVATSTNNSGMMLRLGTSTAGAAGNTTSPFGFFVYNGGIYTNSAGLATIDKTRVLATYSFTAAHTLTVVYNNGTTGVSYDNGARSVAASTFDVWLDGNVVATGLGKFNNNTSTAAIGNVTINGQPSGTVGYYLDNIAISSAITVSSIPEPASAAALLGAGVLGVAALGRRRRA